MRRLAFVFFALSLCAGCKDTDPSRVTDRIYLIDAAGRCLSIDTYLFVSGGQYVQTGRLDVHTESREKCGPR